MIKIPFNKPYFRKEEIMAVARVIKSGRVTGNGPLGKKVEHFMEKIFRVKYALLTTSCTHALEMALMTLGIKENDEVILPSFNFVSAANAVARLKAKPVFVDIEEDYLNIDPQRIGEAITKRTKAIICVHYAGASCKMDWLNKIAKDNNLCMIEDAAHAVGSKFEGRFLGAIGDIGCFSFHGTKNFTCGEGGAFLTNNEEIARKSEIIREKGTNRLAFIRGEVDKYTWVDIGSSYVLSEILTAVLFEQLKKLKYIISKRREIGLKYMSGLTGLEKAGKIILPKLHKLRKKNDINWHLFYFRVHNREKRNSILRKLLEKGIEATFHYVPLHLSPYAMRAYRYKRGDFPVTEKVSDTLIRLPIYPGLRKSEQEYIINCLNGILK